MALTAILAFASGLAAKVKLPPSGWVPLANPASTALLKLRAMQLDNEVERLDRDLAVQKSLVEHWKGEARATAERNVELRLELDAMRARERQAYYDPAAQMAQMAHAQQMAMYNQQQAQALGQLQAQQYGMANQQQQGLLGAQNLQLPAGWDCTCIPDRASALRRS
jgi:regulator of replication initiation timing